ncbi:hypothetical protein ABKN59_010043 [Abortiporus biennis]
MASKQLGKLRQWAGEVISTRDKTSVADDFKDLELDIELRRQGLWKLHVTSSNYKHVLSKKKDCEVLPDEGKLHPVDALGIVMIQHGEEFGDESAFGNSLVSMGRAQCKIATLQETHAISFEETFLASIKRAEDEIKEYQLQRKKLDSRRLSYDAAITKYEKLKNTTNSKKEKEKREAEEEFEKAKARFEETHEDVRARMYAIQENELEQLRELTALLDLELSFAEQHLEVLRDVKASWVDDKTIAEMEEAHRRTKRSPPPIPPPRPAVVDDSRYDSVRSIHSQSASRRSSAAPSLVDSDSGSSSEEGEDGKGKDKEKHGFRARAKSFTRRKSDAGSRAPSRTGRKRSDSTATAASGTEKEKDKDKDKEKEKEKAGSKRISVTGWASSKLTGMGKSKKEKERENFSALVEDEDDQESDDEDIGEEDPIRRPSSALSSSSRRSNSKHKSTPSTSPKISSKSSRPNSAQSSPRVPHSASPSLSPSKPSSKQKQKIVVALHDFSATTSDELTFRAGDHISVTNEVLDGWWMGEIVNSDRSGKKQQGLFPTNYTKLLPASERPISFVSSSSSLSSLSIIKPALSRRPEALKLPDVTAGVGSRNAIGLSGTSPSTSMNDLGDEEHPFADRYIASGRTPINGHFYAESIQSSEPDDYDDQDSLVGSTEERLQDTSKFSILPPTRPSASVISPPIPNRRASDFSTVKRAPPPPPPPRRSTNNILTSSGSSNALAPPIPNRSSSTLRSHSSQSSGASSFVTVAQTSSPAVDGIGKDGLTYSPFDSPRDEEFGAQSHANGCGDFKQNPFKPKGFCNNCFQMHG